MLIYLEYQDMSVHCWIKVVFLTKDVFTLNHPEMLYLQTWKGYTIHRSHIQATLYDGGDMMLPPECDVWHRVTAERPRDAWHVS